MNSHSWRPKRWLWGLIPLALPFLGASFLSSPVMIKNIGTQATESLRKAGFDEVSVTMQGRDAYLVGNTPNKEALDKAVQTVLAGKGVRIVDATAVKVVPPVVLDKPVVNPLATRSTNPLVSGTWPEGPAKTLQVTLDGKSYLLGKDPALTSSAKGEWQLKVPTTLKDGTYDVSVTITDGKKAAAIDQGKDELVIDSTPPPAPKVIDGIVTRNPKPLISGTFNANQTEQLSISFNGNEYKPGTGSPLTVSGDNWSLAPVSPLSDGTYSVTAKAADKLGNISQVVAANAVVVDSTAPQGATVYVVQGTDRQPLIAGKWDDEKGNTLSVTVAGQTYKSGKGGAITTGEGQKWSFKPEKSLEDGKYDVSATTTDKLGNAQSVVAPGAITVDTTPPTTPTVNGVTNQLTKPQISGTFEEAAGHSLRVVVSGKVFALGRDKQLTSDGKGNWLLSLNQPLGEGKHAILAESSDKFSNLSRTEKPTIVVVDTTKPKPPTISSVESTAGRQRVTGTWTDLPGETLQVTAAGQTYRLGRDPQLTSTSKGNWTLSLSKPLVDGSYNVSVAVADAAGNIAQAKKHAAILVDTTKPSPAKVTALLTKSATPVLTGTWSEKDGNKLTIMVAEKTYSPAANGPLKTNGTGSWTLKIPAPLADGTYAVTTTVTDPAGNASVTTHAGALSIDTTAPQPARATPLVTRNQSPILSGTWAGNKNEKLEISVAGQSFSTNISGQVKTIGKNWQVRPQAPIAQGTWDVKTSVTDKAGNVTVEKGTGALVIDTTPPPKPFVTTMLTRNSTPQITGSWKAAESDNLFVEVAGRKFANSSPQLKVAGDNWTLTPKKPIPDGTYDVVVTALDKAGNAAVDTGKNEVVIDTTSPPAPTVRPVFGTMQRPPIAGTWANDGQNTLSVTFNGKTYTLSKDGPLKTDEKGNWTLMLSDDIKPGSYDVGVIVADQLGNLSRDASKGEVWIRPKPAAKPAIKVEPPKPVAAAPVDQAAGTACHNALQKLLSGKRINFVTAKSAIRNNSDALLKQIAQIAKTCPRSKIIVSGHTDSRGSIVYNLALSEARASAVVERLVALGIDKKRMTAIGYGEEKPRTSNNTVAGRAENRRIEFKVVH